MGSGIYSGLGQGLLGVANLHQQYVHDKRVSEEAEKDRSFQEGLLNKKIGAEQEQGETGFKHQMELERFRAEKLKERDLLAQKASEQETQIQTESRERIAGIKEEGKSIQKAKSFQKFFQDMFPKKKGVSIGAWISGDEPTPEQVNTLSQAYGKPLRVETKNKGLFRTNHWRIVESSELPDGVTEDDIKYTMEKHGVTREEVLNRLSSQ